MSKHKSGERYDVQFKQEAVRLLLSSGKSASQLAQELGVPSWSLGRFLHFDPVNNVYRATRTSR